jgi:hypothetical protein
MRQLSGGDLFPYAGRILKSIKPTDFGIQAHADEPSKARRTFVFLIRGRQRVGGLCVSTYVYRTNVGHEQFPLI